MKKICSLLLVFALLCGISNNSITSKAATLGLNQEKLILIKGNTFSLLVSGTATTPKWSSNKKSVVSVSSTGKIKAKKAGSATITARVGATKLKCKVTVKNRKGKKGSKTNPKSAYKKNTFTYYEEGKKKGKFSLKLLNFSTGVEAAAMAAKNKSNPIPSENQEYIYFKFKMKYISGSQTLKAKQMFDYYHNIYGDNGTRKLKNVDWGFFFEPIDDLGTTRLSPGNSSTCGKAILIEKGHYPIMFRIQTGKNSYTWFTTAK